MSTSKPSAGDDEATDAARGSSRSLDLRPILPGYKQVAEQIRGLILRGRFRPGTRLPVEGELAALFDVSRSTVREALRVLSADHLIETTRGVHGGSFVIQPDANRIAEHLKSSIELLTGAQSVTLQDLLEAREILEIRLAGLAAERRNEQDLKRMRAVLPGHDNEVESTGRLEYLAGSLDFHQVLLEATHNALFIVMTQPIFRVLETRFLTSPPPAGFFKCLDDDHVLLMEAIERQDRAAAEKEMARHLKYLRSVYEAIDAGDGFASA